MTSRSSAAPETYSGTSIEPIRTWNSSARYWPPKSSACSTAVAVVALGRIKARPAAGEPVGLVRLVIGAELELVVEVGDEFGAMLRDEFAVDHAFLDQPRGEQFADRRMLRSEEHTSELQSLMRISYAVFCLKKKKHRHHKIPTVRHTY